MAHPPNLRPAPEQAQPSNPSGRDPTATLTENRANLGSISLHRATEREWRHDSMTLEQAARKSGHRCPYGGAEVSMAGSYSADLRGRVLATVEAGATPEAAARRVAGRPSTPYPPGRGGPGEGRRVAPGGGGRPEPPGPGGG